mgnify:CR=1 FL=1
MPQPPGRTRSRLPGAITPGKDLPGEGLCRSETGRGGAG